MLLEKLYDCRIEWQYGVADFSTLKTMAISKRQYLPILIFGLLPKLSDVLQKQVLLFLINCVNVRVFPLLDGRSERTTWRFSSRRTFCGSAFSC